MSELSSGTFERGFPTDWRIRPANFVQFDWCAHTRNMVHLWLPEGVMTADERPLFILSEEADFAFKRVGDEHWVHTFTKPDTLGLHAEYCAIPDGVSISLEVTNLTDRTWPNVTAGVCAQLAAAPDFVDLALERTFAVSEGELVPMAQPVREGLVHHYGSSATATENFIAVNSRKSGFVVAKWWEGEPVGVAGNCHGSIACIHAPPGYGALEPGKSAKRTGGLYFMPGDVEDALRRYRAEATG
ncbi:MAG: hypothetical protein CMJ49_00910 [Planctomycetaceae bacterium]|nr:hypothetical protein [Planctomycetaceae bacterium]